MRAVGLRDALRSEVQEHFSCELHETLGALLPEHLSGVIVVDSASVAAADLTDWLQLHSDTNVLYIVDWITPSKESYAHINGIKLVEPNGLIPYLRTEIQNEHPQPVLTFWGVLPQLGTTTIALSVASYLAETYDLSVGVFGLNAYNPGLWAVNQTTSTLEELKSFLQLRQLSSDKLKAAMETLPSGAHYLVGNRNPTLALHYRADDVSYLLSRAKEAFEVVILDAGSILNTALCLRALQEATYTFVVATDLLYVQQMFSLQVRDVLKPLGISLDDLLLIGNRVEHPRSLPSFAKAMGVTPLAAIGDYREMMYFSEQQSDKLKLFLEQKTFKNAVRQISESVVAQFDLAPVPASNAR